MEKMEQFSHDLTLALEETSRCTNGSRWGLRRRTRSTGNLREFLFSFDTGDLKASLIEGFVS
jgi:hypothetical protein